MCHAVLITLLDFVLVIFVMPVEPSVKKIVKHPSVDKSTHQEFFTTNHVGKRDNAALHKPTRTELSTTGQIKLHLITEYEQLFTQTCSLYEIRVM